MMAKKLTKWAKVHTNRKKCILYTGMSENLETCSSIVNIACCD